MALPAVRRSAAFGLLAAFGAVAAFATIAPREDATPPPRALIVEPLALQAREVPPPLQYVREEQFQRGDTLAGFLSRLGIDETVITRLARAPALRALRPGVAVRADVLADGTPKSLSFLTGRDTLVRIVPEALAKVGLTLRDAELILLHQSNLRIVEQVPIQIPPNQKNRHYLKTKRDKLGHLLDEME